MADIPREYEAKPFSTSLLVDSFYPYAIVFVLLMLGASLYETNGTFTYTIDDPYIHLTLARNIAEGHYGINMGEFASPSSSILWPFLLAPFANTPFFVWVPFMINGVAFVLVAQLIYWFARGYLSRLKAVVLTLLALVTFNLPFVMMTGMEHTLQVLFVLIIALHLVGALPDKTIFYASVIAAPLLRYEDLAIALPALAFTFWQGERKRSVLVLVAIVTLVGGFTLFLKHGMHGAGGMLPSSVQAKLDLNPRGTALVSLVSHIGENVRTNYEGTLFNSLALTFIALVFFQLPKRARPFALIVLVPAVPLYMFGQVGPFDRYVSHVLVYCFVLVWYLAGLTAGREFLKRFWLPLVACAVVAQAGYVTNTLKAGLASRNIHDQQIQMALIVRDFLKEPVAVNDLGAVSYFADQYVLDLWGLGSLDALAMRCSDSSGAWIAPLMARKDVQFAFVYGTWFPQRPATWVRVGDLVLPEERFTPADSVVALYATNPAAAARLKTALETYKRSSGLANSITNIR